MRPLLLPFAILLISASSSFAATLHLTDGSKLQGTILKETPEAVEIQTPDGTLTIKRERIILLDDGTKPAETPSAAAPAAVAPAPAAPVPPPPPVFATERTRRITLALDILGAGNAADALQKDFQLGAAAVANLGY
ncbi:MAG: hypothetical protein HY925_05255, partial [Elusimicrobia bacterium]|nr:hypothetical protein [Elusimicrobiota bacterium]